MNQQILESLFENNKDLINTDMDLRFNQHRYGFTNGIL
jgi:hypothetical protein